ncbi:hypothetical protein [Oceanicoccus sp. KOV_DT_Chl]|uniref:hypothetical protein n=1 Tax=Oceanicoccus sp. KOV_DT_Chl TaxID=1904639 RepID=UPI0011AEFDB3|nr:hypothetical protein [Oceanicoccus sp. KOV_DT_Chl]
MPATTFSQLQRDASEYMIHPFVDNAALKKKARALLAKPMAFMCGMNKVPNISMHLLDSGA